MIIYSDKEIVAVNKKAGVFVQPGKHKSGSLIESLEKDFGRLYPVHRIDAPVSGIVIFARTKAAAASLGSQFRSDEDGISPVEKRYICAVDNPPPADSGTLENNIFIPSGDKINKTFPKEHEGRYIKKAVLDYKLIFRTERYYILEILLRTGRKHQIRVQLSHAGCHIKGDTKYGARRTNPGGGINLHALSLKLSHPATGEPLFLYADPPADPLWDLLKSAGRLPAASDKKNNKDNK